MSWRFVATLVVCATIIAVLVARPQSPAEADHSDGNIACGSPYFATVNYWIIEDISGGSASELEGQDYAREASLTHFGDALISVKGALIDNVG